MELMHLLEEQYQLSNKESGEHFPLPVFFLPLG